MANSRKPKSPDEWKKFGEDFNNCRQFSSLNALAQHWGLTSPRQIIKKGGWIDSYEAQRIKAGKSLPKLINRTPSHGVDNGQA